MKAILARLGFLLLMNFFLCSRSLGSCFCLCHPMITRAFSTGILLHFMKRIYVSQSIWKKLQFPFLDLRMLASQSTNNLLHLYLQIHYGEVDFWVTFFSTKLVCIYIAIVEIIPKSSSLIINLFLNL